MTLAELTRDYPLAVEWMAEHDIDPADPLPACELMDQLDPLAWRSVEARNALARYCTATMLRKSVAAL